MAIDRPHSKTPVAVVNVTHMHPHNVLSLACLRLEDKLVVVEVFADVVEDEFCFVSSGACNVACLTCHVLRVFCPVDNCIEHLAAVTAGYTYGMTEVFSEWFKYLGAKQKEVVCNVDVRYTIVDAVRLC